jgi:hypothetical protein
LANIPVFFLNLLKRDKHALNPQVKKKTAEKNPAVRTPRFEKKKKKMISGRDGSWRKRVFYLLPFLLRLNVLNRIVLGAIICITKTGGKRKAPLPLVE